MAALLPHLTAGLNALSLALLLAGWVLIRSGSRHWHRRAMLSAAAVGALFLVAYVAHHVLQPLFVFRGHGLARPAYFTLLASHVALAVAVAPLALVTLRRALAGRVDAHRALARWTLPLWLYVSASGILVYVLLYHVYA
jgi:uncharacterized membrane protein YozB (DUF420 family)